ncbi:A-adding tRNA nucleotidyltransferase [subsurface metagenome]
MQERLPAELIAFLRIAGKEAEARGQRLYLVGGAVRDLLLERPNLDFDLVVEGDALALARWLAKGEGIGGENEKSGERVTVHRKFGTAKFSRGSLNIDLVTARSETYAKPGALPTVQPGTIRDDLLRRDFSINAMAIDLSPGSFGRLLDPHSGRSDLEQGRIIRILHERSFIDDATRILRALRYEQRLGFKLEQNTERLLRKHKSMLDTISGDRVRHELELILKEDRPEQTLERAQALGVLQQLHPSLRGNGWLAERFGEARRKAIADPALYLLLLIYHLSEEAIERFISRLKIVGELGRNMRQVPRLKGELPALTDHALPPSSIYRLLKHYPPGPIAACALASDSPIVRTHLELYINQLRYVKTFLDGEDLKRLGVKPGPRLGRVLETLREAKLDGQVSTRKDEEALTRQLLGESEKGRGKIGGDL